MHQKVEALEYSGCKLERRSYLQTLSKKLSSRFGLTPFEGPAENDNPVLTWSQTTQSYCCRTSLGSQKNGPFRERGLSVRAAVGLQGVRVELYT